MSKEESEYSETHLHQVADDQVGVTGDSEAVPVHDLRGHPGAVQPCLDRPPALDAAQTKMSTLIMMPILPDGKLGPGVVFEIGRDGDRPKKF